MAGKDSGGGTWRDIGRESLNVTVEFARDAGIGAFGLTWLVVLYALSLGSTFLILSATVFQSTTIQDSASQAGGILKVLRIIPEQERFIIDQIGVTQRFVVDIKQTLQTIEASRQQAEARMRDGFQEVIGATADLDSLTGRAIGPSSSEDPSTIDWTAYLVEVDRSVDLTARAANSDDLRATVAATRGRVVAAVETVVAAVGVVRHMSKKHDDTAVLFKLKTQELDLLRKERHQIRDTVFREHGIPAEVQANVSQVLNTDAGFLIYLVQLPSEFLTFALTVSMGLLGSTIHMSRQLFRDGHQREAAVTVMWYVARPLEGMAAAIIIYIFFRAGQLTLTGGGGSADNKIDDLNPYVLSFLAIASGLLSERAYNRIVGGATNMLGGRDAWTDGDGAPGGPAPDPAAGPDRSPSGTRAPVG
jgi:hypothetical protein